MTRIASQFILLAPMAALIAALALLWGRPDLEGILAVAAILLIFFSIALERFWPAQASWSEMPRSELAGDIGSFVLIFGILDSGLKWLTPFLLLAILPSAGNLSIPLWQQIAIATLWIEFAAWVSHWAHHRYKPLWALHAMHHSTERLYTLNNFRFHPLNHVINHLAMILPLLIVGISSEAVLVYSALALPVLLFQHSNVAFKFGALNRVFNTNDLHRWHHSAKPSEGTKNLGRALVVWDQLFGTYLRPSGSDRPEKIGLFQVSNTYPAASRFWAQLMWPFTKDCCART